MGGPMQQMPSGYSDAAYGEVNKKPAKARCCTRCYKGSVARGRALYSNVVNWSPPDLRSYGRPAAAAFVGSVAFLFLMISLLASPPHLLAAAVSAVLGWIVFYTYSLERECRLLRTWCDLVEQEYNTDSPKKDAVASQCQRQEQGKSDHAVACELDFSGRSLGAFGLFTPRGKGDADRKTIDNVLTHALVNEYLRCASLLKKYQSLHGVLPQAPVCDLSFADALLDGLKGDSWQQMQPHAHTALPVKSQQSGKPSGSHSGPSVARAAAAAATIAAGPPPKRPVRTRSPSPHPTRTSPSTARRSSRAEPEMPQVVAASDIQPQGSPERPALDCAPQAAVMDVSASDPPWLRSVYGH